MNWDKLILEVIGYDWMLASEILDEIRKRHPEITQSVAWNAQGLARPLHKLKSKGEIEDNGAKWPELKKWRRRLNADPVDETITALIETGKVKDREEGLRLLARQGYQANEEKYKEIIDAAKKIKSMKEKVQKII
jgi:hypothetical protein